MALSAQYIIVKIMNDVSGLTEVIAESTSVDAQFSAEAMDATSQTNSLTAVFEAGKNKITVSGDYLTASTGATFDDLFVRQNAGSKFEIEIYRDTTKVLATEGVFTSLNQSGALSDALATGAYSIECDSTALESEAYCASYQAVYDSFTTKPSVAIAYTQDTMVRMLVASGVWVKKDVYYMFAAHTNDNGEALINWKNPGTFDATIEGTLTFTAFEGFTGNGIDGSIKTGYTPSTHGVNYTANLCSFGIYVRNNVDDPGFVMGSYGVSRSYLSLRDSDILGLRLNSTATDSVANTDSRGMFICNKYISSVRNNVYRNSLQILNADRTNTGIPDSEFKILGGVPAGGYTPYQASMAFIGGGLDTAEVLAFTNAIEAYMDSSGKGVIT